jgi:hypothetical protein
MINRDTKNIIEELSTVWSFFVENAVFLLMGIVLRRNFLASPDAKYGEWIHRIYSTICFYVLMFTIWFLVQYFSLKTFLKRVQDKEGFEKKEIVAYLLSEKFSAFSALFYLTSHAVHMEFHPLKDLIIFLILIISELGPRLFARIYGQNNRLIVHKNVFDYSLKLRVLRNTFLDTVKRWELMRFQVWNGGVSRQRVGIAAGLGEDAAELENLNE